jgi:VIT1/CCC1 family predicted Fe2+/Mn2+ transporter
LDDRITLRNICIGLIDGITIPLAVAAGLFALSLATTTIMIACLAVAVGGALTMSIGGFLEARRYEPTNSPASSALVIGLSYFVGGSTVCFPFLTHDELYSAFQWSAGVSLLLLFVAGFLESSLHGKNAWIGGVRVLLTAAVAASAAYFVAKLFA